MQEGVQGSESDLGDLISANRLSDVIHRCHQYVGSVESPRSMLYFQALAIARTLQACINMDVMFDPLFANLSVDEPTLAWASPRDEISLRRAFRGMARLVHPDKTSLPPAGEAFQLLQRGAKALASRFRRSRSPQSRPTGRCIHSESDEEPWWEEWDTEKGKQRGRQGDVAEEYRNQLIREQRTREELSREIGSMKREMARSLGRDASRCSVLRQKIAVATDLLTKATAGEDAIGKLRGFFAGEPVVMLRAVAATKNTYSLSTCVPVKAWHRTPVASRRLATRMRSEADEKKPTTGHDVPKTNVSSEANMDPEVVAFRASQQEAQRITIAEESKSLVFQGSFGVLSTIDAKGDSKGFPSGALIDYGVDKQGRPVFCLTRMSAHCANVVADPRASFTVGAKGFSGLSDARVTLTGTVVKCEDEEAVAEAREAYLEKHPDAMWVDFGDFSLFRMEEIKVVRLISGFGRAGTTDGQGYTEVERDPVVQFSEPVCSHMNDDHADAIKAMVESYTGMTVDTAEMLSIDRLGMTTRCTRQGQSLKARVAWPREVTDRKAVKEVIVEMTRAAAGAKAEAK